MSQINQACLDTQVRIGASGVTVSLAIPEGELSSVSTAPGRAGG